MPDDPMKSVQEAHGTEIEWLSGNCPVQAEGTFDGVPFYFRARGTQVSCDVGTGSDLWEWRGPEYEWPDAGWISEQVARAYIATAYEDWRDRKRHPDQRAQYRRRNGLAQEELTALRFAGLLESRMGESAKQASATLMAYARELREKMSDHA